MLNQSCFNLDKLDFLLKNSFQSQQSKSQGQNKPN